MQLLSKAMAGGGQTQNNGEGGAAGTIFRNIS